ncbi:hypothetical protein LSH36_27g09072 [Paralvinella palmiformis]|uniref:tRNA:m(4)X modification enzyme TRM13 n=1 Tax=Paralvinella palmiformis TaxID=53620 RepID=A0AAD9NGK0_9ANNE|nr:hypothetical protein LSH36_27g09072 [Paralvinella palmiformis]
MSESEEKPANYTAQECQNGVPERCSFYMKKKMRYCKLEPVAGSGYCTIHAHDMGVIQNKRKRIPCPLDPKHSCYEDLLKNHLKKCNARPGLNPPCYVIDINSGSDDGENSSNYQVSIRDVSDQEVLALTKVVTELHKGFVGELDKNCLFHEVLQEEKAKPHNGAAAQKHINQQASLIGHLQKAGLLRDGISYLEFGAGKGGLSHWIQLALSQCSNNQYILIDRSSVRYRMDTYHRGAEQGPDFERIKTDIRHLHLGKIASLQNDMRPIVGVGKHLCGSATDMMLRCLMETPHRDESGLKSKIVGIVLALCCHHRTDWQTYCGKAFFKQCGLGAREFHLISSMTSWATCGGTLAAEKSPGGSDSTYNHYRYGNLLPEEREEIGYQCKQLIDHGRLLYLKDHGYHVQQIYYAEKEQTLENMALVAKCT